MSKVKSQEFIESSDDSDSDTEVKKQEQKKKAEKRKSKDVDTGSDTEVKKQKHEKPAKKKPKDDDSDSDSDTEVKKKKQEKPAKKKPKKDDSDSDSASDKEVKKPAKKKPKADSKSNGGENAIDGFDLGRNRKLSVLDFKGKKLVNIREYYADAAGDLKPGKKGICLLPEQWDKLLEVKDLVSEATPGDDASKEGWELGRNSKNSKRVSINEFKKQTLIDIREYYTDAAGDSKPGKKGISLSLEQWNTVLDFAENINDAI